MRRSLSVLLTLLGSTLATPALAAAIDPDDVANARISRSGARCIGLIVVLVFFLAIAGIAALIKAVTSKPTAQNPPPGGWQGGPGQYGAPPYGGQGPYGPPMGGYGPPPGGGQAGYGPPMGGYGPPPGPGQGTGYGPPPGQAPYGGGPPIGGSTGYPGAPGQGAPRLVGLSGPMQGREFPIGGGVTVGSAAQIAVGDPSLGAQHAWIGPGPNGRVVVRDNGSPSGTYVNNQRVQERELNDQDVVMLGNGAVHFTFRAT
jgi:hypothetical protein